MNDEYYNKIAEGYDELHGEEQKNKIEFCKQFINPNKKERLLDIGCGTGISTSAWRCNSYGIDPSRELIKIAKTKQKDIEYKLGSGENIPYPDDFFDYVISITAIQNFHDITKGVAEMKRVLKDDGKIIISTLKNSKKAEPVRKEILKQFTLIKEAIGEIDIFFFSEKEMLRNN